MTREEKVAKRKLRASKRAEKRNAKYRSKVSEIAKSGVPSWVSLSGMKYGSWADSNSPTGYSQICCYYGICQSPCNGDC